MHEHLLKNAAIITLNGSGEIIEDGFLLLEGGKIQEIGRGELPSTTKPCTLPISMGL